MSSPLVPLQRGKAQNASFQTNSCFEMVIIKNWFLFIGRGIKKLPFGGDKQIET
jgi:hypothetical protein